MDKNLNELLRWGVEHTDTTKGTPSAPIDPAKAKENQKVLEAILSGPSDADLMKESMAAIQSPEVNLDNKLIAFDNFEQLVESIDNANNLSALGLWEPLLALLKSEEAKIREMAAWCVGTSVQNNEKAQEKVCNTSFQVTVEDANNSAQLVGLDAIPTLTQLAVDDSDAGARKKCILALSSAVRNCQPALDQVLKQLPEDLRPSGDLVATDMEGLNELIQSLRDASAKKQ
jgi:hsp70-interacting protein